MLDSKLTTIFCCDLVGFSTMMNKDENGTITRLNECMDSIILPLIAEHNGRKFSGAGDSVYAEFPSAVNAVNFTITCQEALHARNARNPNHPPMLFRFSAHLGEVIVNGTDLLGETVNIAARIEPLAELGGISISEDVYQQVVRKLSSIKFIDTGLKQLKGISQPIRVFSIPVKGAKPNPNAHLVDATMPLKIQPILTLKSVLADRLYNDQTITVALDYKRKNEFNKAIPILAALTAKRDTIALDELINLTEKRLIPAELMPLVGEALEVGSRSTISEKQYKIGMLFNSRLLGDDQIQRCVKAWILCAETNVTAQYELGCALLNDPSRSLADQGMALEYLEKAARNRLAKAAIKLGQFYSEKSTQDLFKAFDWYWVARAYKDPSAQLHLEALSRTMTRADIQNAKINADALVDEINWQNKN